VQQNNDATFTVTATQKAAGTPATGANVDLEVFLNDTHPAPNSGQHTTENGNGTYTIGPVRFDAAGQWTIRFHLHEECADEAPDSPHGHAAFYLHVP
jgi:5-hydroxyisourate hydrolase-like protein (transthyretin family)